VRLGIAGRDAAAAVAEVFGGVPAEDWSALTQPGGVCIRLPSHGSKPGGEEYPRLLVAAEPELAIRCWEAAEPGAQRVGPDLWAWLDLRAGLPVVQGATSEEFVPQMTNLDLIGGVSFTKGCYTGQEVVARMKYLGKLKRRMRLAHLAGAQCPAPGDELFAAGGTASGQGAGKVVDARPAPGGGCDLLAVVENASYQQGDLRIASPDGPRLEFLPLPYGVDEAGD
jgi:tRNA-modifying protein YgfZ